MVQNVNELGVASADEDPEKFKGPALHHLIEKGRKDILQILLDKRDCIVGAKGGTVMSRM